MHPALFVFAVLMLTVYGQLVIKARAAAVAQQVGDDVNRLHYLFAMFTDVWVLSGLMAAVLASICWMLAIERVELGYVYPFMALSFVLVPLGATALFGEPLPTIQLLGIAFIIVGVTVSALAR